MSPSVDSISQRITLNWSDWHWGYKNDYVTLEGIVKVACLDVEKGNSDQALIELACVLNDNIDDVSTIMGKIASDVFRDVEKSKDKWLFIFLSWYYENKISL